MDAADNIPLGLSWGTPSGALHFYSFSLFIVQTAHKVDEYPICAFTVKVVAVGCLWSVVPFVSRLVLIKWP